MPGHSVIAVVDSARSYSIYPVESDTPVMVSDRPTLYSFDSDRLRRRQRVRPRFFIIVQCSIRSTVATKHVRHSIFERSRVPRLTLVLVAEHSVILRVAVEERVQLRQRISLRVCDHSDRLRQPMITTDFHARIAEREPYQHARDTFRHLLRASDSNSTIRLHRRIGGTVGVAGAWDSPPPLHVDARIVIRVCFDSDADPRTWRDGKFRVNIHVE